MDQASAAQASTASIRSSRVTVVCAECKRFKLKCDRRTPCSSCIKRDAVSGCVYFSVTTPRPTSTRRRQRLPAQHNSPATPPPNMPPPSAQLHTATVASQQQAHVQPYPPTPQVSPAVLDQRHTTSQQPHQQPLSQTGQLLGRFEHVTFPSMAHTLAAVSMNKAQLMDKLAFNDERAMYFLEHERPLIIEKIRSMQPQSSLQPENQSLNPSSSGIPQPGNDENPTINAGPSNPNPAPAPSAIPLPNAMLEHLQATYPAEDIPALVIQIQQQQELGLLPQQQAQQPGQAGQQGQLHKGSQQMPQQQRASPRGSEQLNLKLPSRLLPLPVRSRKRKRREAPFSADVLHAQLSSMKSVLALHLCVHICDNTLLPLTTLLKNVAVQESELKVQLNSWHGNAQTLVDLLQECYSECSLDPPDKTRSLRLLQDISSRTGLLPARFWLNDIVRENRRIGSGAEATIWSATHRGVSVAIREPHLPDNLSQRVQFLSVVQKEIISHWQLRHENIITMVGVFQDHKDAIPAMILPIMANGKAADYLRIYGDPFTFLEVLVGTARGLEYLHSRSPPVVHGDMHPGNILIDIRGVAYLSDFGLSRIRHEVTRTHTIVRSGGILRFVAPEVSNGKVPRGRESSDIYSFAMSIFTLGTGNVPFNHINNNNTVNRMSNNGERPTSPDSFHGLSRDLTQSLGEMLEYMWQHDPLKRMEAPLVRETLEDLLTRYQKTVLKALLLPHTTHSPQSIAKAESLISQQVNLREPGVDADRISALFNDLDPQHRRLLIARLVENALYSLLPMTVTQSSPHPSSLRLPHDEGLPPVEFDALDVTTEDNPDDPDDLSDDFELGSEDENADSDDYGHAPYLLSVVRSIEQFHDKCSASTFFEGFKTALPRLTFDSPPGQILYGSIARLLLATNVPRRMVIDLGSTIKHQGNLDDNQDPHDILLVKEWDALRLRSYERQVRAQIKAETEMEIDDDDTS